MNLANKITIARIFLIPVFIFLLLSNFEKSNLYALIIYIIASLTDTLDGYIARKYNMITNFGKFADPLADKLLVLSSLVAFVELGILKSWFVIIIILRELLITGLRTVAASNGITLSANKWGKMKTVIQMITIIVILVANTGMVTFVNGRIINILLVLTLISTVMSGYIYILENKKLFN